jgi:hypothetical protein
VALGERGRWQIRSCSLDEVHCQINTGLSLKTCCGGNGIIKSEIALTVSFQSTNKNSTYSIHTVDFPKMLLSRYLGLVLLAAFGSLAVSSSFTPQSTNASTQSNGNGNSNSNPNTFSSLSSSSNDGDGTVEYKFPEPTLYDEMRDMAALSFLVYSFAYATDAARTEGLKGLDVSDAGRISASRDLPRSFTPKEILDLVEENRDALREKYDFAFGDNPEYEMLLKNLKTMQG